MRKFAFFLFVLFSLAAAQSKEVKDPAGLKATDFSALSFNRLQSLRASYIEFLKHAQTRLYGQESFQGQTFKESANYTVYTFWQNIYLAHAGEGELCFFGGWPSRMSGAYCQAPWKHRGDNQVRNFGPVYSQEVFCGERDLFRCNPVLFGEGESTCVKMEGTYANLTDKCEAATADNVEALVKGIKNDPDKALQLEKFNQAIFGEEGFCSTFKAKHNKEYDACDNLRNRINALMDTSSSGQVEEDGSPAPVVNPGGQSLGLLNECAKSLPEDVNGRGLVQSLQRGLAACGARKTAQTSDLGDLDQVAAEFDKLGFLRQLNLKNFEHKLHALLNIETGFMPEGRSLASQSKDRLFEELGKRFPQLNEDEAFKKLFEKVFAKHQEIKDSGQLQKVSLKDMADRFKVLANGSPFSSPPVKGVNEVCKEINEKFQARHPERDSWVEKALWFSEEEEATIEELRKELNASLNQAVAGSQTGFLLGTEHFQENVMDPTVDFAKECVEDSNYKVLNSTLSERDLEVALGQAQEKILDSFEDLQNSERPFAQQRWRMNARENTADNLIEEYLEENKYVVAGVLAGEKGAEQARASRYLCSKIHEIYIRDGRMQAVSWIGAGASLIGGVACVFPLTAPIGCPVMAAGTAISTAVGGARAYEGYQLGQASALAQTQHNRDASEFAADRKSASDQFVSGATEVALSKGGLVISGVSKLYRASRAGKVADEALESSRGLARAGDEVADTNVYLNRETARLLEGPKGTSLQTAGKVEVRFTDPDTGREYIRFIDSRIIAMGDLDDATRVRAIKDVFGERLSNTPEVAQGQINAIMEAHKRFPCAIGKCSARQLREKLAWMRRKGVPDDVASDSIRFGITGYSDDAMNAMKGQSAIPSFLDSPAAVSSPRAGTRTSIPAGHQNESWTRGLEELGSSGKGPFVLRVEKTMPDGSKRTEEVFAHYRGSDGDVIHLENLNGRFVIDPKDTSVQVRSVSVERGKIVEDGMSSGSYAKYDQPLFETDPARALASSQGKKVKLVREVDGDEIETVGEIVLKDGRHQLRYQKPEISGDKYYYSPIDAEDVTKIERVFDKASWSPAGQQAHTNYLDEAFVQDAPVVLRYRGRDIFGKESDEVIEGSYAGWTQEKGAKSLVVRDSDGSLRYIDFGQVDELSSAGGSSTVFNGGMLP